MRPRISMNILRFGLPLLALALLLFAFSGTQKKPVSRPPEPGVPPPAAVYASQVGGIGITEPQSEIIEVGTHESGIVSAVNAKVGDTVRAGEVLFTLDEREALAQARTARAALVAARTELEDANYQLSLIEKLSDPRAISREEATRRRYASQLAAARVEEAKSQSQAVETVLARLQVTAPIDATVLRVNIRAGEFAQAGKLAEPLMLLGDVGIMHVRVEVDETDALLVTPEAKATAYVRGYPERKVDLAFVRKEPYVKPKRSLSGDGNERIDTRVQEVIYSFDNAKVNTYVGQQMDVFIEAPERNSTSSRTQ